MSDVANSASASELEQLRRDLAEEQRPPVAATDGFTAAKHRLLHLSLLAPVRFADDEDEKFLVHRWTAGALAKRASEENCICLDLIGQSSDLGVRLRASDRSAQQAAATGWFC